MRHINRAESFLYGATVTQSDHSIMKATIETAKENKGL